MLGEEGFAFLEPCLSLLEEGLVFLEPCLTLLKEGLVFGDDTVFFCDDSQQTLPAMESEAKAGSPR